MKIFPRAFPKSIKHSYCVYLILTEVRFFRRGLHTRRVETLVNEGTCVALAAPGRRPIAPVLGVPGFPSPSAFGGSQKTQGFKETVFMLKRRKGNAESRPQIQPCIYRVKKC